MMWASDEQKRRVWFTVIGFLQIMSWVSVSSRPAPLAGAQQRGQSLESLPVPAPLDDKQDVKGVGGFVANEGVYKGLSTLGSRPPSCEHKCGECSPCEAIQVPTNSDHFGVQYANYEPEGWKCRCKTSFFNP